MWFFLFLGGFGVLWVLADLSVCLFSDYDVFLSPLSDFEKAVQKAGLQAKVVYLDRGEEYRFEVKKNM